MVMLRRHFGRVFIAMMLLDVCMYLAYIERYRSRTEPMMLGFCGGIVLPLQAYCFARVGLFEGLNSANSLRATFSLVAKLGLLPWAIFLCFILSWEIMDRRFHNVPGINDFIGFGGWIAAHVLPCAIWLVHSNWQMKRNFRVLASASTRRWRWLSWQRT
jgi:hypothetical protein